MRFTAKVVQLALLAVVLSLLSVAACAQITPSADAYTSGANPTTNYGANTLLYVNGATETTYVQFDLSSIPSGENVGKATLKLYVNSVPTAGSFNVDYVNGTWSESKITFDLAPALGSTIVSSVPITTADKNQYILIDITPAVQAWLSGSQTNDGVALVANSTFNASFDSKENTTTSHPAELDIVFAGGGTIAGVTTASGSGLQGGGTSGTLNLSLTTGCVSSQVLQWNGSAWACASVGTGTVTSVGSGQGLTGGPITGSGTLSIDTTKVPLLAANNTFTGNQFLSGGSLVIGNTNNYQPFLVQSSSTFGTWLELSNTSTNGQTWNILSAGGVNAEGAGNLGITNLHGGTIWLEGPVNLQTVHASGNTNPTTALQGAYLGWNALTGGTGETDFINNEGGGPGGFAFMNTPSSGSPRSTLMFINGNGNVGIGTTSPSSPLDVAGAQAGAPVAFASNSAINGIGMEGAANYDNGIGVEGSASFSNCGGFELCTVVGVLGTVSTDNTVAGIAVEGNAGSNVNYSGLFQGNFLVESVGDTAPLGPFFGDAALFQVDQAPPNSNGADVAAITSGGSTAVASLLLQNTGSGGLRLRSGVGTGTAYLASSGPLEFVTADTGTPSFPSAPAMTIDASGDVHIKGNLSKGGGSFQIDHPLDPANKYLYHSFVESPDMMNIYNGVVTLNQHGAAWVRLPDYFEALNQEFRYQLTSVGSSQPGLYIAAEISGNRFKIRGGKPGGRVSWQVTGIRHDAYANAHRIPVEVNKPESEKNHYLRPELFGAGPEMGIPAQR